MSAFQKAVEFRRLVPFVALGLLLSGCASAVDSAESTSESPFASPSVSVSAQPSPSATEAAAVKATCENVITEMTAADFANANYPLLTKLPSGPDPIMAPLVEQGGLSCYWADGYDIVAWLGIADMDDATWSALRTELLANGYVQSDAPVAGTIQGERAGDAYPALVNRDGVTYYVGYSDMLSSVVALQ